MRVEKIANMQGGKSAGQKYPQSGRSFVDWRSGDLKSVDQFHGGGKSRVIRNVFRNNEQMSMTGQSA